MADSPELRSGPSVEARNTPEAASPAPAERPKARAANNPYFWGTGRRKTAVARVRIKPGDGKFMVNNRKLEDFFSVEKDRATVQTPLMVTDTVKSMDVFVNVRGGGISGQSGAVVLGLARALVEANPDYEQALRGKQLLTRDARKVERKKYGRSGARRRFQFSKR